VHGSFLPLLAAIVALQVGCGPAGGDTALQQADATTLQAVSDCELDIPAASAHGTELSPKFVYAANQNSHDISTFSVADSGALTALGAPLAVGRYPEALALHPSGRSLFVANHGSSTLSVLSVDAATGRLSPNGPEIANAGPGPLAIVAHPNGRWVFVGNDDAKSVSANLVTTYEVDAETDRFVPIASSETGSAGLLAMTLDSSGQFLYTANAMGDSVTAFHLDTCTGSLTRIGEVETAQFPVALSVGASGEYLYVAASGAEPAVQTFAIDPASGALRQVASLQGVFAPWSLRAMRLDASGQFLALVALGEKSSASVSTLAIDAETGEPQPTPMSSVAAGANAVGVALGPAGRFAYVSNFGSNDISSYALDSGKGIMTPLGSVAAGTAPCALAIATGP
jgi:6-phosphogluconolactonase (cycloisomerase 2 family)